MTESTQFRNTQEPKEIPNTQPRTALSDDRPAMDDLSTLGDPWSVRSWEFGVHWVLGNWVIRVSGCFTIRRETSRLSVAKPRFWFRIIALYARSVESYHGRYRILIMEEFR